MNKNSKTIVAYFRLREQEEKRDRFFNSQLVKAAEKLQEMGLLDEPLSDKEFKDAMSILDKWNIQFYTIVLNYARRRK